MKLLHTTLPNNTEAKRIGQLLVQEKLVACANWHAVESCYIWQGDLQQESEIALVCKVTDERLEAAQTRLRAEHPYDVPAIIVLPVDSVNPEYEHWMQLSI